MTNCVLGRDEKKRRATESKSKKDAAFGLGALKRRPYRFQT
jgi:hypothetical protein